MVPEAGVEPVREKISRDFKSRASACSAIPAFVQPVYFRSALYIITLRTVFVKPFYKKIFYTLDITIVLWYYTIVRSRLIVFGNHEIYSRVTTFNAISNNFQIHNLIVNYNPKGCNGISRRVRGYPHSSLVSKLPDDIVGYAKRILKNEFFRAV